jgi:UDP-glucuronate 4-epimerase
LDTFFITGSAGFIGHHVARLLLEQGAAVVGIDNMNDYYDPKLKYDRNKELEQFPHYSFYNLDITDYEGLSAIYKKHGCEIIIHLAAQAGVRYSIVNPFTYQKSNLEGFLSILELARHAGTKNLVFASSSSVYGANSKIPFSIKDPISKPISFYGATKLANEVMAYSYHHLFGTPMVGLRFFTVYGPWGRPDMAYYKFTDAIQAGRPIDVYNNGQMSRSFTFISDVVNGVVSAVRRGNAFDIFNIGNPEKTDLVYFIRTIEKAMGKKAMLNYLPMQDGDMIATHADIAETKAQLNFEPTVSIDTGIGIFVEWYKKYTGTV